MDDLYLISHVAVYQVRVWAVVGTTSADRLELAFIASLAPHANAINWMSVAADTSDSSALVFTASRDGMCTFSLIGLFILRFTSFLIIAVRQGLIHANIGHTSAPSFPSFNFSLVFLYCVCRILTLNLGLIAKNFTMQVHCVQSIFWETPTRMVPSL